MYDVQSRLDTFALHVHFFSFGLFSLSQYSRNIAPTSTVLFSRYIEWTFLDRKLVKSNLIKPLHLRALNLNA